MEHRSKHNLTLAVDPETLQRARMRALELGTSVNAVLRDYLESFAGLASDRRAIEGFLTLTERSKASSGRAGRTWKREDAYDRRG